MSKSKFCEEQISTRLRQGDKGGPIPEATYFVWRNKYGPMAAAKICRYGNWRSKTVKCKNI
jgi:hypothetical protein